MSNQTGTIIDEAAERAQLVSALYSAVASSIPARPSFTFTPTADRATEIIISGQSQEMFYALSNVESAFISRPNFDQVAAIVIFQSARQCDELELEFEQLAKTWKAKRPATSSSVSIVIDPSYQRIISLGSAVVPLILRELQRETDHWFWALRVITGADPVAPEDRGKIQKMADAWLKWGREKGYV